MADANMSTKSALSGAKEVFYGIGSDHKIKCYEVSPSEEGVCTFLAELPGPLKAGGKLLLSPHREWLIAYGSDGTIHMRSLAELDKSIQVAAHDSLAGGTVGLAWRGDLSTLFTCGGDGCLRAWTWVYSSGGEQKASQIKEEFERWTGQYAPIVASIRETISAFPVSQALSPEV